MAAYVAREDELSIGEVVRDLCSQLGKPQPQALKILAEVIERNELGINDIRVFFRLAVPLRSRQTDAKGEVKAEIRRNTLIPLAVVAVRLREAAKSGFAGARPISVETFAGDRQMSVESAIVGRLELIRALRDAEWSVPQKWRGAPESVVRGAADVPLSRAAIVKAYPALNPGQWRNLFTRNDNLRKCLLPDQSGRNLLYSKQMVERWLVANAHYAEDDLQPIETKRADKSKASKRSPMSEFAKPRTHRLK